VREEEGATALWEEGAATPCEEQVGGGAAVDLWARVMRRSPNI
jgi:hypothetical protein